MKQRTEWQTASSEKLHEPEPVEHSQAYGASYEGEGEILDGFGDSVWYGDHQMQDDICDISPDFLELF
jgi:hypothetical protein